MFQSHPLKHHCSNSCLNNVYVTLKRSKLKVKNKPSLSVNMPTTQFTLDDQTNKRLYLCIYKLFKCYIKSDLYASQ